MRNKRREASNRSLLLIGAGPVGLAAARAVGDDCDIPVNAVVDPNPGARTQASTALGAEGFSSLEAVPPGIATEALVAFHSRAQVVEEGIAELLDRLGCNVVTTCEELAYPPEEMRLRLDDLCQKTDRSVVATGANPGFAMDRLPLVLVSACRNVRRVRVTRRVDTSTRRAPLVAKTGFGLSVDEFESSLHNGTLGHVGLEESAQLLAEGLGWSVVGIEVTTEPVTDTSNTVVGQRQLLELSDSLGRAVDFELVMAWQVANPTDRVEVEGEIVIVAEIEGGYPGDEGTAARVVSAVRHVSDLQPGFYRPTDLPLHV